MKKEIRKGIEIKELTTKKELSILGSALTLEGLAKESIPDFISWIEKYTPLVNRRAYVIEGSTMNKVYDLTGDNRYPDTDCTLVAVLLDDMENYESIIMPRFGIGGRWFDDIVCNNLYREGKTEDEIETYF